MVDRESMFMEDYLVSDGNDYSASFWSSQRGHSTDDSSLSGSPDEDAFSHNSLFSLTRDSEAPYEPNTQPSMYFTPQVSYESVGTLYPPPPEWNYVDCSLEEKRNCYNSSCVSNNSWTTESSMWTSTGDVSYFQNLSGNESHSYLSRLRSTKVRWCQVCNEQAGKHSYYGGQVCPSCRAFFRRSVQSRYSDAYTCSKHGNCIITLKTRKNCQYCRFKLCEQAGMRRSWVLADGERKNKKMRNTSQMVNSSFLNLPKLPTEPLLEITTDEKHRIETYLALHKMAKQQTEDLNSEHMNEIAQMVRNRNTKMSLEGKRGIRRIIEQRLRLFALSIGEFVYLSESDQINLLENNMRSLITLGLAVFFQSDGNWRSQVDMLLSQSNVNRLSELLSGIKLMEKKQMEYDQFFFSPWSISESIEKKHRDLIQRISLWIKTDQKTFILLNLMMLFCAESLHCDNEGYISQKQLEFSTLLQRYLSSLYPRDEARNKFSDGIRILSYCRELELLFSKDSILF